MSISTVRATGYSKAPAMGYSGIGYCWAETAGPTKQYRAEQNRTVQSRAEQNNTEKERKKIRDGKRRKTLLTM